MVDFVSNFTTSFVAGGCAGCAVDLVLFPIDSIKTRLHTRTPLDITKLYNGLSWTMMASFPCAATFWSSYLSAKWLLQQSTWVENPTLTHFLASCTGSICTSIVRNPFEVVKQQRQVDLLSNSWKSPLNILKTQGVSGLYAGLFALILREIPYDALQMIIYEFLKGKDYGGADLPLYNHMINGAIAGGIAAFLTTPIDVVKSRLMTDSGRGLYVSFLPTLVAVGKENGLRSLWTGWHVRVVFTTIGGVIFFGTFEAMRERLLKEK